MNNIKVSELKDMHVSFSHIVDRKCTPTWQIPRGVYKHHNLILIYEGMARFQCNGEEITASKGSLVYFKPGDIRWACTFPDDPMQCFAVDFDYISPQLIDTGWIFAEHILPFYFCEKIKDNYLFKRVYELFSDLNRSWGSLRESKIIRCRAAFMEIMLLLMEWKDERGLAYDKIRKVDRITSYISQNYQENISLEDLVTCSGISKSHLDTIFKEVTGKTPFEYLINIRLNKAKDLLRDGFSVSDSAALTGFNDIFYFSRCFKRVEGIPPTAYQKQFKA